MKQPLNRWVVIVASTLVMLGPGALYGFSLFSQPLAVAFGWGVAQVVWAFALANFFLGVGAAFGGWWSDRSQPRIVAVTGVALWGLGNVLAGLLTPTLGTLGLYVFYGVVGGLGAGMAYIAAMSCTIRSFPHHRGLAGGVTVMGFGLGASVYGVLVKALTPYPAIAKASGAAVAAHAAGGPALVGDAALGVHGVATLMNIFVLSGVAFAVVGAIVAVALSAPNVGDDVIVKGETLGTSRSTREMLSSQSFYILWLMLFLNVSVGLSIISNAIPIMTELTKLSTGVVASLYVSLALLNGFGRLVFGAISDRVGRKPTFIAIYGLQVLALMLLQGSHDIVRVALLFGVVLFCYGGGFGTMPAFNSDYFGLRRFGTNYGLQVTAWGCAGLVAPWFGATLKEITGSFAGVLEPLAVVLMIAVIFPFISEPPEDETASARPNLLAR